MSHLDFRLNIHYSNMTQGRRGRGLTKKEEEEEKEKGRKEEEDDKLWRCCGYIHAPLQFFDQQILKLPWYG